MRLDAQVHAWFSEHPRRPWDPGYRPAHKDKPSYLQHAGQTNSPDMVITEMDSVGVQGALLVPVGVYGTDIEVELEASEAHPDRFQTIGLVDHLAPDLAAHLERSRARGLRGMRLLGMREPDRIDRNEFDEVLSLAADLGLVVTLSLAHPLDQRLPEIFRRHPQVFFYFEHLATVLSLADIPNVGIKLTGAPSLSFETYPFVDIWSPVMDLITAFGPDRVSWGSDYSRTAALHSYWDATHYLAEIPGLSHDQLEMLYAGSLMLRTGWRPTAEEA